MTKKPDEKDKQNAKLLNEHYDGIVEHDHPLPNWWVAIFIITIIFGIFYYTYYEILDGPTSSQELEAKLAELKELSGKDAGDSNFADLESKIKDPRLIEMGKKIFSEKCFMCHGDKGQGIIGPNLTDNFWLHGNKPEQILHVIQKGVPDKGMVAWEAVLSPEEQMAAIAFIKSIHGSNPPGAKAPQGEEYKE